MKYSPPGATEKLQSPPTRGRELKFDFHDLGFGIYAQVAPYAGA